MVSEMSNSPLTTVTLLSPNFTRGRTYQGKTYPIDTITIHCFVGQVTAKRGCEIFMNTAKQASCNYVVGHDGSIGLCVEEANRSWCTGGKFSVNGITGSMNDYRAVTIEVACDPTHPYAVTDKAYAALIELCADICRRNGNKRLLWKGDKNLVGKVEQQNMTVHRWFAAKACPGDYLYERHGDIAAKVNAKLTVAENGPEEVPVKIYHTLPDVPDSYRPTIQKLMEKKALCGYSDPDPTRLDDNIIDVDEVYCRVMTTLDRLGVLG